MLVFQQPSQFLKDFAYFAKACKIFPPIKTPGFYKSNRKQELKYKEHRVNHPYVSSSALKDIGNILCIKTNCNNIALIQGHTLATWF